VRNKVKISSSSLSAFVIGEVKSIAVDFSLDKDTYNPGDMIKIRGLAKDEDRSSVSNATIDVYANSQYYKVKTDENGIFGIEVPSPDYEGSFELSLKATKYPYGGFSRTKTFRVDKSKGMLIDFPDTLKIGIGANLTQTLSLVNTGQADIGNIAIYLDGLQKDYYVLPQNTSLKSGERKNLQLDFLIPYYAQSGISSVTLKIVSSDITQEKVFGLNVVGTEEANKTTSPTTGLVSAFAVPKISYMDIVYITALSLSCFSFAIMLKKMRIVKGDKEVVRSSLTDAKNFVNSGNTAQRSGNEKYDKVILTEFPNFEKFSKNLKGANDGKGN
jgi:hypothetical protein